MFVAYFWLCFVHASPVMRWMNSSHLTVPRRRVALRPIFSSSADTNSVQHSDFQAEDDMINIRTASASVLETPPPVSSEITLLFERKLSSHSDEPVAQIVQYSDSFQLMESTESNPLNALSLDLKDLEEKVFGKRSHELIPLLHYLYGLEERPNGWMTWWLELIFTVPYPMLPKIAEGKNLTIFIDPKDFLFYCELRGFMQSPPRFSYDFRVDNFGGNFENAYCKVRPETGMFLSRLARHSEVVFWNSFSSDVIIEMMSFIDPNRNLISHFLNSSSCTYIEATSYCLKNITRTGRSLERSIIIDTNPIRVGLNLNNSVFPTIWKYSNPWLHQFLEIFPEFEEADDVRDVTREYFPLDAMFIGNSTLFSESG